MSDEPICCKDSTDPKRAESPCCLEDGPQYGAGNSTVRAAQQKTNTNYKGRPRTEPETGWEDK